MVMTSATNVRRPRGAFLYYDTLFRTHPLNASLEIVTGYIAQPSSGVVDSGGRPTGLSLLHRNGSSCFVACEYVVDGSPEGWGAAAFGLPVIFGREALTNKSTDDPTVRGEAYAGRRTFAVDGRGPPIESWSDRSVETVDVSSASGPITNLCAYGDPAAAVEGAFDPRSPWLLTTPPTNYREEDFVQPWHHLIVDGSCCAAGPECSPQVYRYQGLTMSAEFQQYTGSTGPTLPGWYTLAGKAVGEHYLRIAYANPTKLWDAKRTVELNAFEYAVGALYYVQNNVAGGKKWGFCNSSYPHTNRALSDGGSKDAAIPAGPYMLSDFGTSSNGGDQTVAHRLYHRQLARMGSPNPVGAAMLYDGESRLPHPWTQNAPTPAAAGAGPNTKKYFEPESVAIALYGTDFTKGVLGNLVPRPAANASGDGVLFGNAPNGGNMHGIHPRMLFPDEKATEESVRGNGGRPPAGNFTRTFVHNYLSPGTPRSTFMLQASARIGSFANNLGVAAGVFAAWAKKLNTTTSRIPTMLVQYTLAADLDTAITFYKPPLAMNGPTYAALMISGAYAVPPSLDFGGLDPEETAVSSTELASWLASYKEGILTGSITPPPPQPPPPPPPPPHPPPSPPNPPKDLGCITGANNASWYVTNSPHPLLLLTREH